MATYRKVGDKWKVEVCVAGKRKSKTLPTKAEVRSWAAKMEVELSLPVAAAQSLGQCTLGDVFTRYADEISEHKKGARWEVIRLKKFGSDPLVKLLLQDLTREHFEDWRDRRLQDVKPSSVNRELNLISHCLTQARRWRLMDHNPLTDLKRPKNPPHRDRRILDGEISSIINKLNYSAGERVLDKNNDVLPLVFKLPLARTGLIRPKYERQQKPECTTEICAADSNVINDLFKPVNTSVSSDFGVVDKSQNNSLKNAMSNSKKTDERQTSGSNNIFNNNIYTFRARNSERLPSLMDSAWLPGVETVEKLVINFGLPPQFIFVQAVDFRLLWIEQRRAVADWDGYFYGACRIQIENGNEDFMRAINNKSGGGYG